MSFYNYENDCFYDELSKYYERIEELKQILADSVKKEFIDKMKELKEENDELQEFKNQKQQYELELRKIKNEYQSEMAKAEMKAKQQRLSDLLKEFSVIGYCVGRKDSHKPKCDKCDEHRKIHFTSPMGRKMTEQCLCAKPIPFYFPKETYLKKFYAGKQLGSIYFRRSEDDNYSEDRYDLATYFYNKDTMTFQDVNIYSNVFIEKEDCQAYCDWLNEKEEQESED